ncbi:hypothetical protein [Streptomyces sp. NPDC005302]
MRKLRTVGRWLGEEWPVPRWICLLIVIGWIVNTTIRITSP